MSNMKRVSPKEAQALLDEGYSYVDVRSVPEFHAGHPAGAYNVPLMHMQGGSMAPNPSFLSVMKARFPKDAKIVVGCKAGGRSQKAAEMLAKEGYTDVVDQRAGWDGARDPFGRVTEPGWSASGLPTETDTPAERTYGALEK